MQLSDLKPLTTAQYETCKAQALKLVKKSIGDRPTRTQFMREFGASWTVLDALALVVFAAALVVSSAHIIAHAGSLATASHPADQVAGTRIGRDLWVAIHQWGYIFLAEASMLLFMVLFAIERRGWRRYTFVAIALVAATFVVVANLSSGTGILESLMPPIFTLGIGFHLERLLVQQIRRRRDVTDRYLAALATWEQATEDATTHPDYSKLLMNQIWEKLVSLKANKEFADANARFKIAAVQREMERDLWTDLEHMPTTPPPRTEEREHRPEVPFGSYRHAQAAPVNTQPTPNGNEHTDEE